MCLLILELLYPTIKIFKVCFLNDFLCICYFIRNRKIEANSLNSTNSAKDFPNNVATAFCCVLEERWNGGGALGLFPKRSSSQKTGKEKYNFAYYKFSWITRGFTLDGLGLEINQTKSYRYLTFFFTISPSLTSRCNPIVLTATTFLTSTPISFQCPGLFFSIAS